MSIDCDYYDGEEKDPRLQVELWELSPHLPDTLHYLAGLHYDERGLVINYSDGSNRHPKNYDMMVVFSCGFECVRISSVSAQEEAMIGFLAQKAGVKLPKFFAFRCRHTNFFNWCVQKRYNDSSLLRNGYHYVLSTYDMLVEVFTDRVPRVFFNGYGMNLLPEEFDDDFPCSDVFYNYHAPKE